VERVKDDDIDNVDDNKCYEYFDSLWKYLNIHKNYFKVLIRGLTIIFAYFSINFEAIDLIFQFLDV